MADADPQTPPKAAEAEPERPRADLREDEAENTERAATRKKWLIRLAVAVIAVGILYALYYVLFARNHVSTDNAYVAAEMAQVTPLLSAQAVEVNVSDTESVRRGQVLVRLDPANARIAVSQAEADLAEARRRFRQTSATSTSLASQVTARGADIAQADARLATARADLEKAGIDLKRREQLRNTGAVSGEELTQAQTAFAGARAAVAQANAAVAQARSTRTAAEGELAANEALVRGATEETDPGVLAAKAKLDAARLDFDRTVIRAPMDGIVTKRSVQVGQRVMQGTPIMTIVPIAQVYVDANFKERQLRRVRPGMAATVTSDLYGSDVVYHGKVAGFSGGTGSSLSLIPAQNATGNWIKVVQRLPVRIRLDPQELRRHPLRVGLSTEVDIHLKDR